MRNHRTLKAMLAVAVAAAGLIPALDAAATTNDAHTVPSGSLAGLRYHVVAPGDSVASIAQTYGVDASTIRIANGLVGDRLYQGARVLLDAANPNMTRRAGGAPSSTAASSGASSSSSSSSAGTYVVKEGDVLERIARRAGVKLSALLSANGLESTSTILPGRKLVLPGNSGSGTSSSSSAGTYVVKEGDVLERIARRAGVKLSALLSANGLESTSTILPGRKLVLPGSSAGSVTSTSSASTSSSSSAGGSSSTTWIGPDMVCPVPGATFMNDWGFPRGSERFHEGTDMFAPEGTTIVAPVSGVVSFGSNDLGGTTFNISTADGWVVYGAHLSDTIGSGGQVSAGTPVGRVGNSGDADGGDTHLHLMIRPAGGRPANAYPSVRAACG